MYRRAVGTFVQKCDSCGMDVETIVEAPFLPGMHLEENVPELLKKKPPSALTACPHCGSPQSRHQLGKQKGYDAICLALFVPLFVCLAVSEERRVSGEYWGVRAFLVGGLAVISLWYIGTGWWFPLVGKMNAAALDRHARDEARSAATSSGRRRPTIVLLLAAFVLLLLQPAYRLSLGPIANVGKCEPPVVAPGDDLKLLLKADWLAVNGDWGGSAKLDVVNGEGNWSDMKWSEASMGFW